MSFIGVALGGFAGDGAIIASLFDTLECEIGRPLVLTFLLHPTGFRWSSGLSEYAGAIIGNWGISIACVVIYDVVARGASAITKRRLREKLKSPSFAFFVEGYFRSVVFASGFVLLFNAEQPSLRVMGAATILLYATIAGALAILLGRRAKYNHAVRSASAVSLWGYVDGEWADGVGDEGFVAMYGGLFNSYRQETLYFNSINVGILVATSLITGIVPSSRQTCMGKASGFLFLFLLRIALVVWLRPLRSGQKTVLSLLEEAIKAVATIVGIVSFAIDSDQGMLVAKALAICSTIVANVGGVIRVKEFLNRKKRPTQPDTGGDHSLEMSVFAQKRGEPMDLETSLLPRQAAADVGIEMETRIEGNQEGVKNKIDKDDIRNLVPSQKYFHADLMGINGISFVHREDEAEREPKEKPLKLLGGDTLGGDKRWARPLLAAAAPFSAVPALARREDVNDDDDLFGPPQPTLVPPLLPISAAQEVPPPGFQSSSKEGAYHAADIAPRFNPIESWVAAQKVTAAFAKAEIANRKKVFKDVDDDLFDPPQATDFVHAQSPGTSLSAVKVAPQPNVTKGRPQLPVARSAYQGTNRPNVARSKIDHDML